MAMTGWGVFGIKLGRMRLVQLQDVARKFDGGDLHAQAQAQVGDLVLAGVLRGLDFALDAAFAETAGHQDAAQALQDFFRAVPFDFLGVHLARFPRRNRWRRRRG